jgi:hypothetical protein
MARLTLGASLALVALLSAAALVLLLPWLKEGYGIEELPFFAGGAAGLAVLGLLWVALTRRVSSVARVVGLAPVAVALAAYLLLTGRVLWNEAEGRRLSRTVRIARFVEHDILWPGFDGPVGLRLEIELEHGVRRDGNLFPPKVLMGPTATVDRRSYFLGVFDDWSRGFLASPLLTDGRATDHPRLGASSAARLVYEVYPGLVRSARPERVCVTQSGNEEAPYRLIYATGTDLAASWVFVSRGGVHVDLSGPLTAALRQTSRLEGHPLEWEALLRRLEPEGLERAGYERCAEAQPAEACYCRPR